MNALMEMSLIESELSIIDFRGATSSRKSSARSPKWGRKLQAEDEIESWVLSHMDDDLKIKALRMESGRI